MFRLLLIVSMAASFSACQTARVSGPSVAAVSKGISAARGGAVETRASLSVSRAKIQAASGSSTAVRKNIAAAVKSLEKVDVAAVRLELRAADAEAERMARELVEAVASLAKAEESNERVVAQLDASQARAEELQLQIDVQATKLAHETAARKSAEAKEKEARRRFSSLANGFSLAAAAGAAWLAFTLLPFLPVQYRLLATVAGAGGGFLATRFLISLIT